MPIKLGKFGEPTVQDEFRILIEKVKLKCQKSGCRSLCSSRRPGALEDKASHRCSQPNRRKAQSLPGTARWAIKMSMELVELHFESEMVIILDYLVPS
jgi:hypothetical protein